MSWRGLQKKYKLSGIYQIEIIVDEVPYFYIGKSKSIGERWLTHLTQLVAGSHHCSRLQSAYNKVGPLSLKFSILEFVIGMDNKILDKYLLNLEKYWMNQVPKSFLLNTKQ